MLFFGKQTFSVWLLGIFSFGHLYPLMVVYIVSLLFDSDIVYIVFSLTCFLFFTCFAPHHEANPSPINRVFIFMTWKKRHCYRVGNHEKVSSNLLTGAVRSQGDPSRPLFLITVHHFVWKIALAGLCLLLPPCRSNLTSILLLTWHIVLF